MYDRDNEHSVEASMTEPTLVIMAAGMGSRFGGLKQVAPVDRASFTIAGGVTAWKKSPA